MSAAAAFLHRSASFVGMAAVPAESPAASWTSRRSQRQAPSPRGPPCSQAPDAHAGRAPMPEPARTSSPSPQTTSHRPGPDGLTEDERSSQRPASSELIPQALVRAQSGRQEVTGKPGNPMTVAHSQAKHLKSIPSPTKSQVTASRAPARLKSVVLGQGALARTRRDENANSVTRGAQNWNIRAPSPHYADPAQCHLERLPGGGR